VLTLIRLLHTLVWAFFVAVILALPVLGWFGHFGWAAVAAGLVALEGVVLLVNGWRCPLTDLAARYAPDDEPADERSINFDIYLPAWLARHNKTIFTTIYLAGGLFVLVRWLTR
jgi:hypothetical protein